MAHFKQHHEATVCYHVAEFTLTQSQKLIPKSSSN